MKALHKQTAAVFVVFVCWLACTVAGAVHLFGIHSLLYAAASVCVLLLSIQLLARFR